MDTLQPRAVPCWTLDSLGMCTCLAVFWEWHDAMHAAAFRLLYLGYPHNTPITVWQLLQLFAPSPVISRQQLNTVRGSE